MNRPKGKARVHGRRNERVTCRPLRPIFRYQPEPIPFACTTGSVVPGVLPARLNTRFQKLRNGENQRKPGIYFADRTERTTRRHRSSRARMSASCGVVNKQGSTQRKHVRSLKSNTVETRNSGIESSQQVLMGKPSTPIRSILLLGRGLTAT